MEAIPRKVFNYRKINGEEPFDVWLRALRDGKGRSAVLERLLRAQRGVLGHCDDVGEGVWGFKIDVGPGYRVYFGQYGPVLVILLCGGEKHGQQRDIAMARVYWRDYKNRQFKEFGK